MNQTKTAKRFDLARLAPVASEPNLSSFGWAGSLAHSAASRRRQWLAFLSSLIGTVGLGLMLGSLLGAAIPTLVVVLIALGAGLMVSACTLAEML